MKLLQEKNGLVGIRFIVLAFTVLICIAAALLFYPPISTRTAEEPTSGDVTFTDRAGNPLEGTFELSGVGVSSGSKSNYNFITWKNIPNVRIKYDALSIKNLWVDLLISGDSPGSNVILDNYGIDLPQGIDVKAPGVPVKYVEISATGISFSEVNISIQYTDEELKDADEKTLTIYQYEKATEAWGELPAAIDTENKTLSATVSSLSVFAVSARTQEQIDIHDTRKKFFATNVKTYDEAKELKKSEKTNSFAANEIPENGELEIDAIDTKNVAVKLKVKTSGGGEIVLDDYGKNNPVSAPLPGIPVKFVEISATGISFSEAEITIRYTDNELNGADEARLSLYHWNGDSWDPLPATLDTVNNLLTATTDSLSPFAISAGGEGTDRILVATNRYVILDDPRKPTGANVGPGFALPRQPDFNTWDYWSGKNTRINATALYIDNSGTPVSGKVINFTIYRPDGAALATVKDTTNSLGLANFSYDMNSRNYYGNWTIRATSGSLYKNTSFIYNWWGCSYNSGTCDRNHGTKDPPGGSVSANSPYLSGRDPTTADRDVHFASSTNCTFCHQSFDGKPGDTNPTNPDPNHLNTPPDVHRTIRCDNASCHGAYNTGTYQHNTNMVIYSCYNSNCHVSRADISSKSTLSSSTIASAVSLYSVNNGSSFNATFHTPNSTVPCFICHGPMHNITKPDETQRFIRNSNTESTQCTTCHTSYKLHNSSVNCTLCHSDDVHAIKVFAQNATYITLNKNNPNPARGSCTSCHQNSSFYTSLKSQPRAGSQAGRNPPQVAVMHSDDIRNGSKWNSTNPYWSNTSQIAMCKYCHGETMHKKDALGRPSLFSSGNMVNGSISGTWCQQCHWQNAAGYSTMVSTFMGDNRAVPPEITGNASFAPSKASDGTSYFFHGGSKDDPACRSCHGGLIASKPSSTITDFMHSVAIGAGGDANCISCHDIGGTGANRKINNSDMNKGVHAGLNKNATNSTGVSAENKKCWGCHTSNGSEPGDMGDRSSGSNGYKCYDCHNLTGKPYANVGSAPDVSEHFINGSVIKTANATNNLSSCLGCHNLTEMKVSYNEGDGYSSNSSLASHYGKPGLDLRKDNSTDCSYCHQNTTTVFRFAMADPVNSSNISNHSSYNSSPDCTSADCHNSGLIHDRTLTRPSITLPSSAFCLDCHGKNETGATNYTGSTTGYKEKHNNVIDCTNCHLNTTGDIHPVQYLQQDGGWNKTKTSAVSCPSCHQGPGLGSFSNASRVPSPVQHSDRSSNGSIWNRTDPYWINTSQQSMCYYCHGNTKHNATALGRPANWKGSNTVNSMITSTSTWCSGCHYQGYASDGKGYADMISTFAAENLSVPPEITNHPVYAPAGTEGYYIHSLTPDNSDPVCRGCHGNSSINMIAEMMHNLSTGTCKDCHFSIDSMTSSNAATRYVNESMYTKSPHGALECEDCHTKGHNNIAARKSCDGSSA